MKIVFSKFALTILLIASASLGDAQFGKAPGVSVDSHPSAPVVDRANIISAHQEQTLNSILTTLWEGGGSQIQVLTLPSLNGIPIAQKAFEISERWELGNKERDNGVLLLVSMDEKKIRIEVGEGLEGALPDGSAWKIIEDFMVPLFRSGRTSSAVYIGVHQIIQKTDPGFVWPDGDLENRSQSIPSGSSRSSRLIMIVFLLVFLLMVILGPRGYSRSGVRSGYGGAPYNGTYGADHWRGGGGWSGGGGGFSGGGASGGW